MSITESLRRNGSVINVSFFMNNLAPLKYASEHGREIIAFLLA